MRCLLMPPNLVETNYSEAELPVSTQYFDLAAPVLPPARLLQPVVQSAGSLLLCQILLDGIPRGFLLPHCFAYVPPYSYDENINEFFN